MFIKSTNFIRSFVAFIANCMFHISLFYLCIYVYILLLTLNRFHTIHFIIIYFVFKEIPKFILMLVILILNKILNSFSVINLDFEHEIFLLDVLQVQYDCGLPCFD